MGRLNKSGEHIMTCACHFTVNKAEYVRGESYAKLEDDITRCKEIAERDGADYSALKALNAELVEALAEFVQLIEDPEIATNSYWSKYEQLLKKAKGAV